MQAIHQDAYGPPEVLKLVEIKMPEPADNEVRIKVHAASVSAADVMMRKGTPYFGRLFIGMLKPKNQIPGTTFAGTIDAMGSDVHNLQVGDRMFGETALKMSAHAEYVCLPSDGIIAKIPDGISFEQAAPLCDGAMTSLNFLQNLTTLQAGQRVLINGASGGLGTAAIELAKHFGAHVTGVCSTKNVDMVLELGADEVIDYTKTDFTKSDKTYDVIFDTVGKSSFGASKGVLRENGEYLSPVLGCALLFDMLWTSKFSAKKAKFEATGLQSADKLRKLIADLQVIVEAGKLHTVIDHSYPLADVSKAHAYVENGHKRGNVVLMMAA